MADGVALPASGVTVATDELTGSLPWGETGPAHAQYVKLLDATGGSTYGWEIDSNGWALVRLSASDINLPVVPQLAGTGTITSVPASASSVTILAANAARISAIVYNDSTANLYLATSNVTVTTSLFSLLLAPGGVYEDYGYTGVIKGLWASATGSARVTERV